jgi:hypothetical protein
LSNRVPGRPDRSGRPTKAQRKEQARLERDELQRKIAARSRRRRVGIILVALGAAVAVAAFTLMPEDEIASPKELLQQAGKAKDTAGCGDVTTTPPYDPASQDRIHVDPNSGPPLSTYPTTPPASGPHADIPPGPLDAGVYGSLTLPDLYRAIHSLEHGAAIVWYDPTAPSDEIARLTEFYDRRVQDADVGQDRVIVAPYDFPEANGVLPEGTQMALVAWHRLQTCASVNLAVAFDFTSQYSFPTSQGRQYQGEAPEAGAAI